MYNATNYIDDAIDWANNLDRTSLGATAVPISHLIASRALEMYIRNDRSHDSSIDPVLDELLDYSLNAFGNDLGSTSYNSPIVARTIAEMFFWHFQQHPEDESSITYFHEKKIPTVDGLPYAFKRVNHVYDNPEKLRFFEVNIWDDKLIDHFLAAGVDVHLAEQLLFEH